MILSMDVLPTPPASPEECESNGRDGTTLAAIDEEQVCRLNAKRKAEEELTLKEWLNKSPVYLSLQSALTELSYVKLKSSPHNNNCLLFSYYLGTNAMTEEQQRSRYLREYTCSNNRI